MSVQGDFADQASAIQMRNNELAMSFRKQEGPAHVGHCLHCGEELNNRRWCNATCRDAWQLERR